MSEINWPRRFRKNRPYEVEELLKQRCLSVARAIMRLNEEAELIEVLPPENVRRLGPVYPPAGGEISEWFDHRVVRIGGRYYDCMTGPKGMTEDEYRALFKFGAELVFRKADEP
jgi:hypothetical protein